MNVPKIFSAIAAAIIFFATSMNASAALNFVDGVDWQKKIITVTGEGFPPPNAVSDTQAKILTSKAAQGDAYAKLAEIVNGVRVESETTVGKLTTYNQIKLKVTATLKGAKIVEETFFGDDSCRVTVQMPLFGSSNSLARALFERTSTLEPFPNPVWEVAPSIVPYTSTTPVSQRLELTARAAQEQEKIPYTPPTTPYKSPLERISVQPLDSISVQNLQADAFTIQEPTTYQPQNSQAVRPSVKDYANLAQGDFTGLIVDCRGLNLQPVMSPLILNINGTKIYGHKNIDIDKIIREGVADYITDIENADRAGKNPLVVKAVAVENFNSNPVLTVADSNRVLIENYATKFLNDLKVVFLFDR